MTDLARNSIAVIISLAIVALAIAGVKYFFFRQPLLPMPSAPTSTPLPMPSLSTGNIEINEFSFTPAVYKIRKGTKIIWVNRGKVSHTVTAQNFGGQHIIAPRQNWTFDTNSLLFPGEFDYRCDFHPQMHGKIIVLPEKDEAGFRAFFYGLPEEKQTCISEALKKRLEGFLDGTITIPTGDEQQGIEQCLQSLTEKL